MQDHLLGFRLLNRDVFDQQSKDPLPVLCLGVGRVPQTRQILGQVLDTHLLLRRKRQSVLLLMPRLLFPDMFEVDEGVIPPAPA